MTQQSDLILVGTLRDIRDGRAQLEVEQTLKGDAVAPLVSVAPVTDSPVSMEQRIFRMGQRISKNGESVLLFLTRDPTDPALYNIMVSGWSAVQLAPDNRVERIEAVEYLLALPALAEKDAIARAMLKVADSDNAFLRTVAAQTVRDLPRDRDNTLLYEPELLALLRSPRRNVRQTALNGLEHLASPRALPLLIEIARGDDENLAASASLALGKYDTTESVATLIELSHHRNSRLRQRAIVDLGNINSERPEIKAALIVALDDADPTVRALAPTRFIGLLREKRADDVVPKIIEMLNDPVAEVQINAAVALRESAGVAAVAPLFEVLRRPKLDANLESMVVSSLARIYFLSEAPARPPIDDDIERIVAFIERNRDYAASGGLSLLAASATPQTLAALRQIAANHPDKHAREYAQELVDTAK